MSEYEAGFIRRRASRVDLRFSCTPFEIFFPQLPREHCNLTKLLEHFGKFGEVVNIEVNFRGDQEAALVSFRHPPHARAAYRYLAEMIGDEFVGVR